MLFSLILELFFVTFSMSKSLLGAKLDFMKIDVSCKRELDSRGSEGGRVARNSCFFRKFSSSGFGIVFS